MKPVAKVVVSHDCRAMLRTIGELPPEGSFLYAIPADQVLVPRELLEELLEAAKDGAAHKGEYLSKKHGEPELFAKFDTLLHP